jgi:signal transduction histidine kinase
VTAWRKDFYTLFQEIGLPAVRIRPGTAEVIDFNELFTSLVKVATSLDYRHSFVKSILPNVNGADQSRWKVAFAHQTPVQVQVAIKPVDGQAVDYEMRSFVSLGQKRFAQSILCVFIPFTNSIFERVCNAHLVKGQELERARIRNELHKDVSQQLLGAAFGCKLLAGKVGTFSEDLGKEASYLADLVNEAVIELQKLVHSTRDQT